MPAVPVLLSTVAVSISGSGSGTVCTCVWVHPRLAKDGNVSPDGLYMCMGISPMKMLTKHNYKIGDNITDTI